ncbi:holo-ACP synthase [Algicola sagamiensis]|uniref:holo-ACP synthase n=1 Tax=Algicola sagamiensis TaxID=163869 RepID=UPI00036A2FD3|nr:holo-ACP synthase [Algicola sagamiensis]
MAIVGFGTDILDISRVVRSKTSLERLAKRILHRDEYEVFQGHHDPARYVAKRFAVKEAGAKALGTGIAKGVTFQQIISGNLPSGQPTVRFEGKAKKLADALEVNQVFVSISDEKQFVVASVILER